MNTKAYKSFAVALSLFLGLGLGLTSCNLDEEEAPAKTLEEYKMELSELVTIEKALVENVEVGYNMGNYKSATTLLDVSYEYMKVILQAEDVLADPDVTITDLYFANTAMASPGETFHDNLWISDRRPIHELILVTDTLRAHTPEGFEVGMAPPEPRDAFKEAISEAKGVRGRSTTIERQVDEAVIKLSEAHEVFKAAIIK